MTIFDQLKEITDELISQNGMGCEINSGELKALISTHFGTNLSSIIPSDYCYNRVNKGIVFSKHSRLFAYVDRGVYKCLGTDYLYNEPAFTRPKDSNTDVMVGIWENGDFTPNENWERCGLK